MQANLCVCGTDIKDQAFVINSCKNGICVIIVDNYVSGIIRLIKIPIEERNLMGKRGRDWLEKNRSIHNTALSISRLLS